MCWLIYVLNGCLDLITAQEICFAELTRETAAAKAGSVFTKVNFEQFSVIHCSEGFTFTHANGFNNGLEEEEVVIVSPRSHPASS